MCTRPPSPATLHNLAAGLSQIRFSSYSTHTTKKGLFQRTSNSTYPGKRTMHSTQQVQPNRVAQQAAKSQQAGTSRPYHQSYHEQDSDRARPGGSRALPTPPRKDHYQDWHKRDEDNLMMSLPHNSGLCMPLQGRNSKFEQRLVPQGPRRRQFLAQKAPRPQARMSEIYSLIDDYMAWNKSSSDLILDRPGSSGTMFVDFTSNGEMEVSYRNGIHKKLPVPPGPSKISTQPITKSYRRESKAQQYSDIQLRRREVKQVKVCHPHPPYGLRHDSVISSGTGKSEQLDPSQQPSLQISRPLPPIPCQNPGLEPPQSRKSYPLQIHCNQRSVSQNRLVRHSSPTPSQTSDSSFQTARTSSHSPAADYMCDAGHTLRAHRSSSTSQSKSWTLDYFGILASTHNTSAYKTSTYEPSSSPSHSPLRHTWSNATTAAVAKKPLPALPHSDSHTKQPETSCVDKDKRSKVLKFVQKLLHKLDRKSRYSRSRQRHSAPAHSSRSWM